MFFTSNRAISRPSVPYSLASPGMPPPGPDFVQLAEDTGNEAGLDVLYHRATFEPGFQLPVPLWSRVVTATSIPGHLWRNDSAFGPVPADVMIVGKWPGAEEAQFSRNMVGPSGRLLRTALLEAGMAEAEVDACYVTNIVKHTNLDPASNRLPSRWISNWLPVLHYELRLVRPRFLLVLGAEAAAPLLGLKTTPMSFLQDRVFKLRVPLHADSSHQESWHEVSVMALTHPAAILRDPSQQAEWNARVASFVKLVRGKLESPEQILLGLNVERIETEEHLARVVDEILASPHGNALAVDLEWHGRFPTQPGAWLRTLQFTHRPDRAYIIVFRGRGGRSVFQPGVAAAVPHLKRLFLDSPTRKVRLIGHNFRADLPWIRYALDEDLGRGMAEQFVGPRDDPAEKIIAGDGKFGWQKTETEGGFDTMLAFHAYQEVTGVSGFKLEALCQTLLGIPRWDTHLQEWKKSYRQQLKLTDEELLGYGECPDDILLGNPALGYPSYAGWDVAGAYRLYEALNRPGGLLDRDRYGNNCRMPFWVAMRASPACLEMETTGLLLDKDRAQALVELYSRKQEELTVRLQQLVGWPSFNPRSHPQCVALLFGTKYVRTSTNVPEGARLLYLEPLLTSGKRKMPWSEAVKRGEADLYQPATDKQVLNLLLVNIPDRPAENAYAREVISLLRDIRYLSSVTTRVLGSAGDLDDEDAPGLLSWVHADGRIRTHIFQTKETGRFSSTRPPMQNLSKRREADYARILGDAYSCPLRSIFRASPGFVLVEADYIGAELYMMAVQSGDENMIDHCERAALPDGDPRKYDLHSAIAVKAFQLRVKSRETLEKAAAKLKVRVEDLSVKVGDPLPPLKLWLAANGDEKLRDVSKTIMFGIPYGRGDDAVLRAIEEEGVRLDVSHARAVRQEIFRSYPKLEDYLEQCRRRVKVGWMANWAGRFRRFPRNIDDKVQLAALEREAGNFPIQGGVADLLSMALDLLYHRSDRVDEKGYRYRLLLPVHDAVLVEVREDCLSWFVGDSGRPGVIHQCMSGVPVYRCDLNGRRIPGSGPHYFAIETSVSHFWGHKG